MNRIVIVALALVILLPASGLAQTRSRTTSAKSSTKKPTASAAVQAARAEAADKVATQIKNLTKFVYLLGGVAKGIEQTDEAAKKNEASPAALQTNAQNKTVVKDSLRNVREGLDALEIYFRATPGLESYYVKLAGSAAGAATAEDLAGAGQFDRSGRTLLGVINRLTDVLVAMR